MNNSDSIPLYCEYSYRYVCKRCRCRYINRLFVVDFFFVFYIFRSMKMIVWHFIISLFSFVYLFLRIFRLHKFKYKQCVRPPISSFGPAKYYKNKRFRWFGISIRYRIILDHSNNLRVFANFVEIFFRSKLYFGYFVWSACNIYTQWKCWWVLA